MKRNSTRHEPHDGFVGLSRRQFLGGMGAALTLAVSLKSGIANAASLASEAAADAFAPNAFIRIDEAGKVTVVSSYLEMGQGTFTGLATLAAEELDVPMRDVSVVGSPADLRYANPILEAVFGRPVQGTGGSTAMAGAWNQMREAAATARQMLVNAAARRWQVEPASLSVTDGVVVHEASGQRIAYRDLLADAAELPVPENVQLKSPDDFRLIGAEQGTPRVDVPAKTNGSAIFTQDKKLPGMLVAVIAHPPKLWGKVQSVDSSQAEAIPGVVAVVEVPGDDKIQGGVAVLAHNTWVARQGRGALKITWDDSQALTVGSEAILSAFRDLAEQPGIVAEARGTLLDDAPEGGTVIEAVYEQPYLAHSAMEPMNCLVDLQGDRCDIYNGEQWHTGDQSAAAEILGFETEQVSIHQLYAGGSFGRRANARSDYVREAVTLARTARDQGIEAPIKLVWMREDDMRATQYRPLTVQKSRMVLDDAGKLLSWHWRIVGQSFMEMPEGAVDDSLVEGAKEMDYDVPNLRVEQHNPTTFPVPVVWLRSVGHTHTAFVGETQIDEAARATGQDPYQFRRSMLGNNPRALAVLDLVAEKSNWDTPLPEGENGERRHRGMALRTSFGTVVAHVAEVTLHTDGSYVVDRVVTAIDCGVAINPDVIRAQMEGGFGFGLSFLRQGIVFEAGSVVQSNFNDYPVMRMNATPQFDVHIVPSSNAPSGVGEPGVPPAAPAVANALAAMTGHAYHSLPLGGSVATS
ncbi:xanthine dehydrogenase family protein molybdopterin-binding subunit [Salinicola avicenniae]|uniref:xanthine dehydrogenase family protein molybdopterin-binding subunit n=1 Tax=Salinicola avicenniae TaxID=2916836 RepID=UPI0020735B23|nr:MULTISPECIES: xanthine dehydrogenase family protein molybdopterin-binding subunit [unclassified Salinicola]